MGEAPGLDGGVRGAAPVGRQSWWEGGAQGWIGTATIDGRPQKGQSSRSTMIRHAVEDDLLEIVSIYNASIPARLATADTEPVSVESRVGWFRRHEPSRGPLRVLEREGQVAGWLAFEPFYGRPAYGATAEVGVYVAPAYQRSGVATALMQDAVAIAPDLGYRTLLGFVFGHNAPSLRLFERFGFESWGSLPRVAELDGVERDLVILGRRVAP